MSSGRIRYGPIIDIYRQALLKSDPTACRIADARVELMGEGWVCDNTPFHPHEWVSAREINRRYGIPTKTVYGWHRRNPEKIARMEKNGRVVFQLVDVLRFASKTTG